MNVDRLLPALFREAETRAYIIRLNILDQSRTMLKVRLFISADLFVQIYRNDKFDTTSFVLIHAGRRIYARDQLRGIWHRHTVLRPDLHDTSSEGTHAVEISEFLDETESVLASLGLP
jgi:hypothetical protein